MIQKVGQNLSPKSNKSDIDDRSADESHITLRGERDVICLRNPTEDKRAFRADQRGRGGVVLHVKCLRRNIKIYCAESAKDSTR